MSGRPSRSGGIATSASWRFLLGALIGAASMTSCAKGSTMGQSPAFHVFDYKHFDLDAQGLTLGIEDEDFQVQVPTHRQLTTLELRGASLHTRRLSLRDDPIGTSNEALVVKDLLYVFQGSGASLYSKDGHKTHWSMLLWSSWIRSVFAPFPDASVLAVANEAGSTAWEQPSSIQRLLRFHPQQGRIDTLLELPEGNRWGDLRLHPVAGGFLDVRNWDFGDIQEMTPEIAHFYTWEGKPAPHPLAHAINLLHAQKIDLNARNVLPEYGTFFPSRTRDSWGLFLWEGLEPFPKRNLFLLSATDTVQAFPVDCDRLSLVPIQSLDLVLVNPRRNLFVVAARPEGYDSMIVFLGRVRKDTSSRAYRAETFRVGVFPQVREALFSRNGEVLVFAFQDGNGDTKTVFARVADLAQEVNKRYPDAHFDLDELQ